ncbi:MAG: DUF1501 domain-containing protein [Gammaproteobacteria bacterium]|nr:DUF1501 domain-containing protein [Gammaproteobacteria bacterium]
MSTLNKIAAHPTIPSDHDILVCVFQRGAADGLNALVPYSDADYYTHRPTIGVAAPGGAGTGIYVTDDYALNPALASLKPIYDAGDLALVHATGVPHQIRSHFSAQNLIERGVVEKTGPNTGWLGRHLASSPAASSSAFRAISISGNVPVALSGAVDPLAIDNLNDFGFDQDILDSGYADVLADLFQSPVPFFGPAGAALTAMSELQQADIASILPANGAVYPDSAFGNKMRQAGQLIKSELPVEVVCVDSDGWDHHESLPTYIDISLTELANTLAAFNTDMGAGMARITVLVYTEFGRRVAENGSLGTDHGTASLAYLMGGGVNGGQVISDWPGLDIGLNEDLQITTDLRSVISELLNKRLGGTDVASVFPGFNGSLDVNAFI